MPRRRPDPMDAITKDILRDIKIFCDNRELKLQHVIEWSTGPVTPGEGEVSYTFPNGDNWRYAGVSFTILKALDNRKPQVQPCSATESDPTAKLLPGS